MCWKRPLLFISYPQQMHKATHCVVLTSLHSNRRLMLNLFSGRGEREKETAPEKLSRRSGGCTIDFLKELNRLWTLFFCLRRRFSCSCTYFIKSSSQQQPSVFRQVGHCSGRGQHALLFQGGGLGLRTMIMTSLTLRCRYEANNLCHTSAWIHTKTVIKVQHKQLWWLRFRLKWIVMNSVSLSHFSWVTSSVG